MAINHAGSFPQTVTEGVHVGDLQMRPGAGSPRGLTQALGDLSFPHATAFTGEDGGVRELEALGAAVAHTGAPA